MAFGSWKNNNYNQKIKMNKKNINITIDENNYIKAIQKQLIKNRQLSELINNFLSNYFNINNNINDLDLTELINNKEKLEAELKENEIKRISLNEQIININFQIQTIEQNKINNMNEVRDKAKILSQMANNSDWLED